MVFIANFEVLRLHEHRCDRAFPDFMSFKDFILRIKIEILCLPFGISNESDKARFDIFLT